MADLNKLIDELQTKLAKAQKDVERIDFLADKDQWIANVQMPREIVERNLNDLRNAIDEAMDLVAQEQNGVNNEPN